MPLKITIAGALYTADPDERARFANRHWTPLPGLFDEGLLCRFDAALSKTAFAEISHERVAADSKDLRVMGAAASELLVLLCNDPVVLHTVADMTGCAPLTRFNGSIYRMLPARGHEQAWHDDVIDGRSVTLSVNVGASYGGGVLEIRDRDTQRTIARIPNPARGDGVLFKLDRALEHRVTPVTNGVKTAFAGWFRRGTPLRDELRAAV
jgi:2OG-Fe(II) oxygenase superfamily